MTMIKIDWDDPAARFHLAEQLGPAGYNAAFAEYMASRTNFAVTTVNGHAIRPVLSRFGRLYHVGTTDRAFATLAEAKAFAEGVRSHE